MLVPPLHCQRRPDMLVLPLALRMEFLVALLAYADQLPLACTWVPDAERQVRPFFQVLDMMDDFRWSKLTPNLSAPDALSMVQPEDLRTKSPPFGPGVELCSPASSDQRLQLGQPCR